MQSRTVPSQGAALWGSVLLLGVASVVQAQALPTGQGWPSPRELSKEEERNLARDLSLHFQQAPGKQVQFRAAGAFRFINTPRLRYIDRTDTGSVAFEKPDYGIAAKPLEASKMTREVLLPRVEAALRKARLDAPGMQFSRFQDEFAAAAEPKSLPRDFDPRKAGVHVARTAVYERELEGVPIFGSELTIGLLPAGDIGRLRMHWPKIDPLVVATAQTLQKAVQAGTWKAPATLPSADTEILEKRAGVGHSGFADPVFKAAPVVRVLYRTRSADRDFPTQTTGYKYFDESGRDVVFHAFPRLAETPQEGKPEFNDKKK